MFGKIIEEQDLCQMFHDNIVTTKKLHFIDLLDNHGLDAFLQEISSNNKTKTGKQSTSKQSTSKQPNSQTTPLLQHKRCAPIAHSTNLYDVLGFVNPQYQGDAEPWRVLED